MLLACQYINRLLRLGPDPADDGKYFRLYNELNIHAKKRYYLRTTHLLTITSDEVKFRVSAVAVLGFYMELACPSDSDTYQVSSESVSFKRDRPIKIISS